MAFDGIVIASLVKELNDTIQNGRISKIAQPEKDELLLTIKCAKSQVRLVLSASASLPLVYLTEQNKPSPMTAPNFCMLLRKHIANGKITRIFQPHMERIIHFEIEHLDDLGDLCHKQLIVEIMGKHSNIIFCDENGKIICPTTVKSEPLYALCSSPDFLNVVSKTLRLKPKASNYDLAAALADYLKAADNNL